MWSANTLFRDGTAAAPTIAAYSDNNTGIFFPAADTIAFSEGGVERLRIADAGQIGIGGANYGTSGQVLTSGGSGAAPSWAGVLGQGQTWQAVARTSGVVYQNTTGRPIMVSMMSNNTSLTFAVSSDNVTYINLGSTGTNVPSSFQAIVPNNHYYRGTGGIATATELR
jgi:hypothetical protein